MDYFFDNKNSMQILRRIGGINEIKMCKNCEAQSMQLQKDISIVNIFIFRYKEVSCICAWLSKYSFSNNTALCVF